MNGKTILNQQQIQVCLVEISHLVASLSEAAAAETPQLVPLLLNFLGHKDHGVRFEASTALAAICNVFPRKSFQILDECLGKMKRNYSDLVKMSVQTTLENYEGQMYARM